MSEAHAVQLPDIEFEVDQLTVVVLSEGPRRHQYSEDERQRLLNGHLEYTIGLVASGRLLHAGALIDNVDEANLTGLSFSELPAAELEPLIENDPAVKAGLESFRFLTHVFPKGSIEFRARADAAD